MRTRLQRFREIANTEMCEKVIRSFINHNKSLDDLCYLLISDYLISLSETNLDIDIDKIIQELPNKIKSIKFISNSEIGGVYGKTTPDNEILINKDIGEEKSKLYFFHELTHIIQRHNSYGPYNISNDNGDFFNEGMTQSIAEMLYKVSSNTNDEAVFQNGKVPYQSDRIVYSSLELYQLNESYLKLFGLSIGLLYNKMVELSFEDDNRETITKNFDIANYGNESINPTFDELEEIYAVNYLLWTNSNAYELLKQKDVLIEVVNGKKTYKTNLDRIAKLMDNYEEKMIKMFFKNNNEDFVKETSKHFCNMLTTNRLKNIFKEYESNWFNDMKNQRLIISDAINSCNSNEELFENAEKIKKMISNNSIKKEFDFYLNELKKDNEIARKHI